MLVTTATVGESFRNDPSLSSASATRKSPDPSLALEPRLLSFPPTTAVGSHPAPVPPPRGAPSPLSRRRRRPRDPPGPGFGGGAGAFAPPPPPGGGAPPGRSPGWWPPPWRRP